MSERKSNKALTPEEVEALIASADPSDISEERIKEVSSFLGLDIDGVMAHLAREMILSEIGSKRIQLDAYIEKGISPRDYPELELMELEDLEVLLNELYLLEFEFLLCIPGQSYLDVQ